MAARPAMTFSEALAHQPLRAFQWATVIVCALVLVSDGIDMQLLGIVAPLVIHDFGVDRGTFGIAMSAALVGFGLGAWGGGRLGDAIGRRYALAGAALLFSLATIFAGRADGVWQMAAWRIVGGLGFGTSYSNALAMTSEWLPERWRPLVISTISVGTPVGGSIVGWLGPGIAAAQGWRTAFAIFGLATLVLVFIVLAVLRDSPSFLLARRRQAQAEAAARRILPSPPPLLPEREEVAAAGSPTGVLARAHLRLNLGIGIAFAATAVVAYGILNWTTTYLTAAGFTLAQAGAAISVAGLTSLAGSIGAGALARRFGTRRMVAAISATLVLLILMLGATVELLPPVPSAGERLLTMVLVGAAAAVFSAGISTMYVIMVFGYPQSCRSAGIGFGIFTSRVGAVAASGLGGTLLDAGHGSVVPFFGVLTLAAALIAAAALIVDRHMPPQAR